MKNLFISSLLSLIFCFSCRQGVTETGLFELLDADDTGIDFENNLNENDSLNVLEFDYLYNGGGVAVGDFNNDGLPDIFFTGNTVSSRLYLNQGNLRFKDVTIEAGVFTEDWCEGVTLVDINNNGYLDIYVSVSNRDPVSVSPNLLFVNQGPDADGIPFFEERAAEYGIDDIGYNTQAAFFDYDLDGDLDLYVLSNAIEAFQRNTSRPREMTGKGKSTDKLYRNNGDGTFTDVSEGAGILIEGYGLGLGIADFNQDGWPDIYIGNDFLSNDILYINNGDGTFTNQIASTLKHQSFNAMGVDLADFNNDAWIDIAVLDMMPPDHFRQKTMFSPTENYDLYFSNLRKGYEPQVVRNTLQLNNANGTFSEIGLLAGIYQTDWSWAPLFVDLDNDGLKDLFISNGYGKDITDMDFVDFSRSLGPFQTPEERKQQLLQAIDQLKEVKLPNFIYKNKGDLTFEDVSRDWGIIHPSISNGAAFADLDNDGDLDLILNNFNQPAFIYKNNLIEANQGLSSESHYLKINLKGSALNRGGIGAKIYLFYRNGEGGKKQYYEHFPTRGYKSFVDQTIHFGLGSVSGIDSIRIIWPDGQSQMQEGLPVNQTLTLDYKDAEKYKVFKEADPVPVFHEVANKIGLAHLHKAHEYIDFKSQRLIPHKQSEYGPGIAVGDVDKNGLEDFYVGGSAGFPGTLYRQQPDGSFSGSALGDTLAYDDMGCLFFDADGDGFLDLYVVSGGSRYPEGAPEYQDRLYINDGKGNLKRDEQLLPKMLSSGSVVVAADYDQDGDLDLFIGGRLKPRQYGLPGRSYLLKNEGGVFREVTLEANPDLEAIGMVTDALWSDFDGDGLMDLILTGEWMPITLLQQKKTPEGQRYFENVNPPGLEHSDGWWNSLSAGDFDGDGDIDYIAGNLGLNTRWKASKAEPVRLFVKDFDGNGSIDPIMFQYLQGEMHAVPGRRALTDQIPGMKSQFPSYYQYATTSFKDFFSVEQLKNVLQLESYFFSTAYIQNKGNGQFSLEALPNQGQFSPVFGLLSEDINRDGRLDLLMIGNFHGNETVTGPYDASYGTYWLGKGDGTFQPEAVFQSGWKVDGNARSLVRLQAADGNSLYLASQYSDSLKVFELNEERIPVSLKLAPLDVRAELILKDGTELNKEFYYGDSYLSQSSRMLVLPEGFVSVAIEDFQGNRRIIRREDLIPN